MGLLCTCQNFSAGVFQTDGLIHLKKSILFLCIGLATCGAVCLFASFLHLHDGYNWYWHFFLSLPGFPNEPAAEIALNTVKSWIEENTDKVGHVSLLLKKQLPIWGQLSICAGTVCFILMLIHCEWRVLDLYRIYSHFMLLRYKHPIHLLCLINHPACGLHAYQIKSQSETNQTLNGLLTV